MWFPVKRQDKMTQMKKKLHLKYVGLKMKLFINPSPSHPMSYTPDKGLRTGRLSANYKSLRKELLLLIEKVKANWNIKNPSKRQAKILSSSFKKSKKTNSTT